MFCAMMAQLDDAIGNVTDALKAAGIWEDTLIAFTSDNGGNGMVGGLNYPFNGVKSSGWEVCNFVQKNIQPFREALEHQRLLSHQHQ